MARKKKENIIQSTISSVESRNPERDEDVVYSLGLRLKNKFLEWKRLRGSKELEWLENLRQHKGIYDPDILAKIDPKSSKTYPKITKAKDLIVISKLHEMLFSSDRNWGIESTPIPNVSKEVVKELIMTLSQPDQNTGEMVTPPKEVIDKAILDYSKLACASMEREMEDQLIEMKYDVKIGKPVLKSGIIYGTGVSKGTLVEKTTKKQWILEKNKPTSKDVDYNKPYFQFIKVWDWYPDMTVTEQEDIEGSFERHKYSKHGLRKLMGLNGFNVDAIKLYMTEHSAGDYKPEQWETDVRELSKDSAGATWQTGSGDYIDMGNGTGEVSTGAKYEVLEYWGYVDGHDLAACGADVSKDELDTEVEANVWLLGGIPIKAVISPLPRGEQLYKLFYYEKDETNIFGEGLPRAIRNSALAIAAAARMMLNNAAICGGPQFEINWDLINTDVCDVDDIKPMKLWIRNGMGAESNYPAVRVYNVDSHMNEYMQIINQFQQFGDIEATLPTWMIAEPLKSGNETAGAVSMKMGTINISLRDLVRNFDDFTENILESLYMWNMEYNDKKEIKGDYKVRAKGSSSIIMKEVRINALNMFATTMQPEDWAYIPRRQFIEGRVKANDLDIEVRTEEEAQQYMQSMVDQRAKELQYQDMEAEIDKKRGMALKMATASKKTNVEVGEMMSSENKEGKNAKQ